MAIRTFRRNSLPSAFLQRIGSSASRSAAKIHKSAYIAISTIKGKLQDLLDSQDPPVVSGVKTTRPLLSDPILPPDRSFGPSRFFTRGAFDKDKKKNPEPIPYLMSESQEVMVTRPIPRNRKLLRALNKGKGTLRKNAQGLYYLDVDNSFISSLFPLLKTQGLVRPPYFNLFGSPDGAHIPVITAREAAFHSLDRMPELGKEYSFDVENLYSVEPASWPEVQEVWFFQVHAEELETLRRRCFLPSLPSGYPFHVAIAVKARKGTASRPIPPTFYRINPAFLAA
ncbi:MAG: hypothetical protein JSS32_07310 [Verrucomicrobia bacterium]|nr:hypothetical protein [Verrucomicrobiota bacterium]